MNGWKCIDLKCVRKPTKSRHSLTHHANRSIVEQNKNIEWSESLWNQSDKRGKDLWRKGFAEEPSLKFRMKDWTSIREDEYAGSEDGKDDVRPW